MPPQASICPNCAARIEAYEDIPYDEKLGLLLGHPIRENRMIAIQTRGGKVEKAIPDLETIVHDAEDIYMVGQALIALAAIGTERARTVISLAKTHESPWIRRFAAELLAQGHQNTRFVPT